MIQIGPLKLKAQIFCSEEPAIGPGKADLLEAIDSAGSISAAGRTLGMSYRRAWLLADSLNRCWAERVVETLAGGGRERGARLTPFGRTLLLDYRTFERALERAATDPSFDRLQSMLRAEPLPPHTAAAHEPKSNAD
jgi:molybdate transport system regulatory protein